jgi:predicted RNA-binding protein with RPS1 domain
MEWKKVKFMQERVGEDFDGLIISVTKFGFFVELTDLFVEGLVPLNTLMDDRYTYHENTREIIGQRSRKTYRLGQRIRVLVDRIDPVEKKIQFAVVEEETKRKKKLLIAKRTSAAKADSCNAGLSQRWKRCATQNPRAAYESRGLPQRLPDLQLSVGEGPASYRRIMWYCSFLPVASLICIWRFGPKWRAKVRQSEMINAVLTRPYTSR